MEKKRDRRGFIGRLVAVAAAGTLATRAAAAKEFPNLVRHPRRRFVAGDRVTVADLNGIMERIERLEVGARLG